MAYDPDFHDRRSTRLFGYDYSRPGAYFVTLCTAKRRCLFGSIVFGRTVLNAAGSIVQEEWTNSVFRGIDFGPDQMVVMPNHVHAIVHIRPRGVSQSPEGGPRAAPTAVFGGRESLGNLVNRFNSASARRVGLELPAAGTALWQRGFYDHVIRSERALQKIRRYIRDNPSNWAHDRDNPGAA